MNKQNREMLDLMKKSFEESVDNIKVPDGLKPENMAKLLAEVKESDFSVNTGTHNDNIVTFKRIMAIAAALAVVFGTALLLRYPRTFKISESGEKFAGYDSVNPIRKISDSSEAEKAAKNIVVAEQTTVSDFEKDRESRLEKIRSALYEKYGKKEAGGDPESESYISVDTPAPQQECDDIEHQADIVKRKGDYLYILRCIKNNDTDTVSEQIAIVKAVPSEKMSVFSVIEISSTVVRDDGYFELYECFELYIKDNTLVAMIKKTELDSEITIARYYDISNPHNPVLKKEQEQAGKYIYSRLCGGILYVATAVPVTECSSSVPSLAVDGTEYKTDNIMLSVNAPESSYLFVTATDLDAPGKLPERIAILGCGSDISASGNSFYITRTFASSDSQEYKTEIYRFASFNESISMMGSYVLDGSIAGGVVTSADGNVNVIVSDGVMLNAYIFDSKLHLMGKALQFSECENAEVIHMDGRAFVEYADGTVMVDFTEGSEPQTVGKIDDIKKGDSIMTVDNDKILVIGDPEKNGGRIVASVIEINSRVYSVARYTSEINISCAARSEARAIIQGRGVIGIPVIRDNGNGTKSAGYIILNIEQGIEYAGMYEHESNYFCDAATRGSISDNILYTVSGSKAAAFDLTDRTELCSVSIK